MKQGHIRQVAKIGRTTYHKCMKELEGFGYIKYVRSYSPILGSLVYLVELGNPRRFTKQIKPVRALSVLDKWKP